MLVLESAKIVYNDKLMEYFLLVYIY